MIAVQISLGWYLCGPIMKNEKWLLTLALVWRTEQAK